MLSNDRRCPLAAAGDRDLAFSAEFQQAGAVEAKAIDPKEIGRRSRKRDPRIGGKPPLPYNAALTAPSKATPALARLISRRARAAPRRQADRCATPPPRRCTSCKRVYATYDAPTQGGPCVLEARCSWSGTRKESIETRRLRREAGL